MKFYKGLQFFINLYKSMLLPVISTKYLLYTFLVNLELLFYVLSFSLLLSAAISAFTAGCFFSTVGAMYSVPFGRKNHFGLCSD